MTSIVSTRGGPRVLLTYGWVRSSEPISSACQATTRAVRSGRLASAP
jgi:hypothetical protein